MTAYFVDWHLSQDCSVNLDIFMMQRALFHDMYQFRVLPEDMDVVIFI